MPNKIRLSCHQFQIKTSNPDTKTIVAIPHRNTVKYLGVSLDYLIQGNVHIKTQLEKATTAFRANSKIFRNKHLTKKTKMILYMLLIRPIITYAAPIWWNTNHTMMKKLRKLERQCLRVYLSMYRCAHSDF